MLGKLRKAAIDRDQVVIMETDGQADIATVFDADDEAVYAASATQDYAIPLNDLKAHVGPAGRIYTLGADPEYVSDIKRLAQLEKNIVLRHITQFEKVHEDKKGGLKIKDIMLYALIGILLLAVIFK